MVIRKRLGRCVSSERLKRLRENNDIAVRSKFCVSDSELRSLILQGAGELRIWKVTGHRVTYARIKRMRVELGVQLQPNPAASTPAKPRKQLPGRDDLFSQVKSALSFMVDPVLRDDAVSEMYLAVLEGTITLSQIRQEARKFSSDSVAKWQNNFGPRSLDAALGEGDLSLLDRLEDRTALEAFDRLFQDDEVSG